MLSPLSYRLSPAGHWEIRGRGLRLGAALLPPRGSELPPLEACGEEPETVAGVPGSIAVWAARGDSYRLVVNAFRPADGTWLALRLGVANTGAEPFELQQLVPLHSDRPDGLQVGGAGPAAWRVLRMSRQKNDIPGVYRPAKADMDAEQARIDGAELRAGRGVSAQEAAQALRQGAVLAEPFLIVRHDRDSAPPAFLAGVLGQTEHLTRIYLGTAPAGDTLSVFSVVGEFDHVLVPPGAQRHSHWVLLAAGDHEQELVQFFVDRLRAESGFRRLPARPPPTIYCSWYYYGPHFTQADLEANLRELVRRPIPLDIFQIDDGWADDYGSWQANDRFPAGLAHCAGLIRRAGYVPGIWTCPFVLDPHSPLVAAQPQLRLCDHAGNPCIFPHAEGDKYVLDPTAPGAAAYLDALYRRLEGWGFHAHKLDFLRATSNQPDARFHDRSATRAQAYRRGLEIIRQAIGPDSYLLACGGLFEASIGLVDGQRIGSDVKGRWQEPGDAQARAGHLVRIKQNVFRAWTNAFWHTDPDALQLRRRTGAFRGREDFAHLADGSFTDDEAFTCVVNQYLGGGLICFAEHLEDFADDRLALLRHVIPSSAAPAQVLDWGHAGCPTRFLTAVTPQAPGLAAWHTLTVCNWQDRAKRETVDLGAVPARTAQVAVFEFATQRFLGVFAAAATLAVTVPAHGSRVLRVAPWDGRSPLLLGTDLHLTGGAVEFARLTLGPEAVTGELRTPWRVPVRLTVGLPAPAALLARTVLLAPGTRAFATALAEIPEACLVS